MGPARIPRLCTFAFFFLAGFVFGMWVVHIPIIERRAGLSHATLGWLLLLLALAALAGMRLCGPLVDRFGSRTIVTIAGLAASLGVIGPGLASGAVALAATLIPFGFANGALDVAINAHAVAVERRYGRPIMSAFHAVWSVGGVAASLVGAAAIRSGLGTLATLLATCAAGLGITVAANMGLLRHTGTPRSPVEAGPPDGRAHGLARGLARAAARRRRIGGGIRALGLLAFLLMLAEGVANDWATVDLRDVLGARPAAAALGYGTFAAAMTTGRLCADRIAARLGPVFVLRRGAMVAAAGLTAAALAPWLPLALLGWAVFGIGLSGGVPQVFTAAGNAQPQAAGANLSWVAGTGYFGLLTGPAAIGAATRAVPLNVALLLPVVCCLAAAGYAGRAAPDARARTGG